MDMILKVTKDISIIVLPIQIEITILMNLEDTLIQMLDTNTLNKDLKVAATVHIQIFITKGKKNNSKTNTTKENSKDKLTPLNLNTKKIMMILTKG